MIKNFKWLLLVSLTFVACNSDDAVVVVSNSSDGLPLTAGTANFSKYVALGNSLTSGYSDGALFIEGQKASHTNIMADQFKAVGGGDFKIPFMSDNIGGFKINGAEIPGYGPRLASTGGGAPTPVSGVPTTEILISIVSGGPYNNCGVPGAKSFHLLSPSYGSAAGIALKTANPYYVRFAPNGTTSVLTYAMSQAPTFFSLWIGANDVLGYAITGGDGTDPITPSAGPAGAGFDATYDALVNTLTSGGAKGVVANIPYVTTTPFFTTVPYNSAAVTAAQASALNSAYAAYNGGLTAAKNASLITEAERLARTISFTAGANGLVMNDEYLTTVNVPAAGLVLPSLRQTTSADYVLLSSGGVSAQAFLPLGNGTQFPLADKWVLSKSEVLELKTATDAYNTKIKAVATAKVLAFVDINALMTQVAGPGFTANGFTVTAAFVIGGGFSTDGVHPSPRGYAMIANKFTQAINTTYGSNLKAVDLGNYRILFPKSL
ncbi:G-D-S-L family lipolytic protein [Flavobacterium sp. ALD4]|uniref:G-D-S-L family lipolytic protein n=1 Tax=Flavobacterium sp. ALD4 TaxID=2058314 RepID=UPI000C34BEF6|nr:G-D-S-L family lipolytic protein [Flavobacterium sp. ALD4]PKH66892.1 G-D-S-L family lipolytic protein [Flavobacterium sp. ALD4]